MKPQNFRDCGGPWRLRHLGFFANHLKLVNSIPELDWATLTIAQEFYNINHSFVLLKITFLFKIENISTKKVNHKCFDFYNQEHIRQNSKLHITKAQSYISTPAKRTDHLIFQ